MEKAELIKFEDEAMDKAKALGEIMDQIRVAQDLLEYAKNLQ